MSLLLNIFASRMIPTFYTGVDGRSKKKNKKHARFGMKQRDLSVDDMHRAVGMLQSKKWLVVSWN